MLKIPGTSALSDFRVKKLLAELQVIDSNITAVLARFIHFVDIENDLNDSQTAILSQLLSYGSLQSSADNHREILLVVPRSGTISPWSSKATEIAQRCGLSAVKRIERGIEYSLMANKPVSTTVKIQLSTLLHDRMTQTVLYDNAEPDYLLNTNPNHCSISGSSSKVAKRWLRQIHNWVWHCQMMKLII